MYNPEQKEQFLGTITNDNSHKVFISMFNKAAEIETAFGKDVADMSLSEITLLLDVVSGKGRQSIVSNKSLLSSYVDWCINNGKSISSENNFNKASVENVDKTSSYRVSYLASEEELTEMLNVAFPLVGYEANYDLNTIRRAAILLLFLGMDDHEVANLKKSDVDYENGIIHSPLYSDVFYQPTKELLGYLSRVAETDVIEYVLATRIKPEKLCLNNYMFRAKVGKFRPINYDGVVSETYVWKRVDELNKLYVENSGKYKKVSIATLSASRRFIDYYNAEDKEAYLDAFRTDLEMKTEKNKRQIYMTILNFKKDYETWEKAFH